MKLKLIAAILGLMIAIPGVVIGQNGGQNPDYQVPDQNSKPSPNIQDPAQAPMPGPERSGACRPGCNGPGSGFYESRFDESGSDGRAQRPRFQ